ncbi:MAG: glycosyltransferase, partial [Anaerolineae bacterium]|nr:glycosyltransferase [Anaerolineae bacterium]
MPLHQMPHLVLLTHTFPYASGEAYLETELPYLAEVFPRITLVPRFTSARCRSIPSGILIDRSFAHSKPASGPGKITRAAWLNLTSSLFYREIRRSSLARRDVRAFIRVVNYVYNARAFYLWLMAHLRQGHFAADDTLFYAYWLIPQTIGFHLVRPHYPQLRVVARAHRGDLYENQMRPPYLPFQKSGIQAAERIFTISEDGRRYLAERHRDLNSPCEVARLGTKNPGFTVSPGPDGVFRVVSVSSLRPVKQVGLLIEALAQLAGQKPARSIEWHHLGDGALRDVLEQQAHQVLDGKIAWTFHGQVDNARIFDFYREYAPHVFINVSRSEGVPVSIMEAQSCGIPVIATDVGGTHEIVSPE